MIKIQTRDLTGQALDWAVAKCEGYQAVFTDGSVCPVFRKGEAVEKTWPKYSTDWSQGGPIIEREKIDVFWQSHQHSWVGSMSRGANKIGFRHLQYGPTPLIAAMHCYVVSKLGDEVEIPKELLK